MRSWAFPRCAKHPEAHAPQPGCAEAQLDPGSGMVQPLAFQFVGCVSIKGAGDVTGIADCTTLGSGRDKSCAAAKVTAEKTSDTPVIHFIGQLLWHGTDRTIGIDRIITRPITDLPQSDCAISLRDELSAQFS